jgi:integrase
MSKDRIRVRDLVELAQREYELCGFACAATWRYQARPLTRLLGELDAAEVSWDTLEEYKRQRVRDGAARSTVNRELDGLSKGFSLLIAAGVLTETQLPRIRRFRLKNAREGFVSVQEFDRICSHLPEPIDDVATFAYWTGWRRGEVLGLTWSLVVPGRWARALDKNGRWKAAVLSGPPLRALERAAVRRVVGCELVFHRGGRPVRCFRKAWRTAVERSGVGRRVLFHDLRRSFINNGRQAGVDRKILMEMSGHRTHAVFDRYQFIDEEEHREAARRMRRE